MKLTAVPASPRGRSFRTSCATACPVSHLREPRMLVAKEPERLPCLPARQVRKARRFVLTNVCSSDLPLAVVSGGHEYCWPGYAVPRAAVPYYSVEFIARGRG